mgnify:CR=1 FL=1
MDKSIINMSIINHSPRFKPWAMSKTQYKINRFNGFKMNLNNTKCPIRLIKFGYMPYGQPKNAFR